jgi:hypothetical protein
MKKKDKLPITKNPTTKQLLNFLRTIEFDRDCLSYVREIWRRVFVYKEIEELQRAYKKVLEKSGSK